MSTVNLKKLAVGMRTIEDLEMRLKFNIEKNGELIHITRNKPKRSEELCNGCLLYTSPSPRDLSTSRMPSSA